MCRAFGSFLNNKGKVVTGRDTRPAAETIELAAIAGLTASGLDVIRCGVVPTAALIVYEVLHAKADAAVLITGSHIASERIGLIFMHEDGSYISDEKAAEIEDLYFKIASGELAGYAKGVHHAGTIKTATNVLESYANFLTSKVNPRDINGEDFHVLVDPGNGTASSFFSSLLHERYRIFNHAINDVPDKFSFRMSEPVEENLTKAIETVQKLALSFGVAFDLDADRVAFMTPKRGLISTNTIGAVLTAETLKQYPEGKYVFPVNTSGIIEEILSKNDQEPIYCRIGQPATIEMCKKVNAVFSFEESGKYYHLYEGIRATDAPLTVLKMIEILNKENQTLDELLNDYTEYYSLTRNFRITEELAKEKDQFMKRFFEAWKSTLTGDEKIVTIDGYKVQYPDKSWVLFRPSGTEPKIRIVTDASSREKCQALSEKGVKMFSEMMGLG
jgi:phosphomannomutase